MYSNELHSNELGRTGLWVSAIGFGAAALGDVYGTMTSDESDATVLHAIDHGINFFDVAPYYGLTLAEERLGYALADRRDDVILATKCGRYGRDHFDFSAATVVKEFEGSLRRLKTGCVDLLQVHDVEFGSVEQIVHETIPALKRLQEQGKTRFIGITGYWPALLADILEEVSVDTVLNYCHSNLLMDDMETELAPVAKKLGVGLLNASPLHMGLLSGGPVPDWHPAPAAVKEVAAEVVALCRERDVNPATLSLNYCLQRPPVASTLIGFGGVSQVDDALSALHFEAPADLLLQIHQLVSKTFNVSWPSGLSENQPQRVPHLS